MTDQTRGDALNVHYRELTFERAAVAEGEPERYTVALSSGAPATQMDRSSGAVFLETLEHTREAIDFSRARNGLPLLLDHDPRNWVGTLENVRLDSDGVMRADARFSKSQRGQEVEQDVRDGIRRTVSVGYRVLDWDRREPSKRGELPHWHARKWMPLEGSILAIPADIGVGFGRSADGAALIPATLPAPNAAPKAEERSMSDTPTAATGNGAAPQVIVERSASDDARAKELVALGREFGVTDEAMTWIADGTSVEQARRHINHILLQRAKEGPKFGAPVQLSDKEEQEYSFARAIMSAADGSNSFEREISETIRKNLPQGYAGQGNGGGFFVPTNIRNYVRRDASARDLMSTRANLYNAATYGAEVVFDVPGSFIELLRKKARVAQAGATVLSGLQGPVTFPKQTGAMTAYWVGENPTAGVTQSDATLGTVTLTPKTVMSLTKFSKQLMRQATIDVETFVRNDIARVYALAWDLAALAGTGSSNQPTGVMTNTSVNSFTLGSNGSAPTYAHMLNMVKLVEEDDADTGAQAFITNPGVKYKLATTQDFTSNGAPIWQGGPEGVIGGYRAYATNQMPSNYTQGTSTTVCSGVAFGNWSECLIGEWGALELTVDPFTEAAKANIVVTSFAMLDVALRYPEAFCRIKDALTT